MFETLCINLVPSHTGTDGGRVVFFPSFFFGGGGSEKISR